MLVGLPLLAIDEANSVLNCHAADQLPGFEYGGKPVQLLDSKTKEVQFPDRALLLLGGDSSRYVLFDCKDDTTLRVPASNYIVIQRT